MHRSVGITIIAILALLGSVFTLAMGVLMLLVMVWVDAANLKEFPGSPMLFKAILSLVSLMYVLSAIWGIFSGIGLFRLKNWARISTIVFSVLLILMSAFSGLVFWVMPFPVVPNKAADPSVMSAVRVFTGVFWSSLLGIGIWWLVFLNRPKVRQQFGALSQLSAGGMQPALGPAAAGPNASKRPLSITILAWFLLVGSFFVPLNLLLHAPVVLFAKMLTGWPAALCHIGFGALNVYIGVGLLRLRPAARVAAIAVFVFGFLNTAVFYFAPGSRARMLALVEMQQSILPWIRLLKNQPRLQFDPTPFFVIGSVVGLAVLAIPLYILITSKQAFEEDGHLIVN